MGAGRGRTRRVQAVKAQTTASSRAQAVKARAIAPPRPRRSVNKPTSEDVSATPLTDAFSMPSSLEYEESLRRYASLNRTLFFSALSPTLASPARSTSDRLSRHFDAVLSQLAGVSEDATWQEFVADVGARREEILALNRLPIVAECQKQARHASGGKKFQQLPLVVPYDVPGAFANPAWGVVVIPRDNAAVLSGTTEEGAEELKRKRVSRFEKARWLKDEVVRANYMRREVESWERQRANSIAVARHLLVHECVHLTQKCVLGDEPHDADKAILEGVTELLTRHELRDGFKDYYEYESNRVIRLLMLMKGPVGAARRCSVAGFNDCLPTLAAELGVSVSRIRSLYERDGEGPDADSRLRGVLDSRWDSFIGGLEDGKRVVV